MDTAETIAADLVTEVGKGAALLVLADMLVEADWRDMPAVLRLIWAVVTL